MIIAKTLLPPLLLILLGACGSTPPSNYYMLSANAGGMPGSGGPSLGIGPIEGISGPSLSPSRFSRLPGLPSPAAQE